ncbi:MAG: carbohydrate-binding protein [Niastella sp.]|nr:carbohydrate-binding protein [Niastella sp.]
MKFPFYRVCRTMPVWLPILSLLLLPLLSPAQTPLRRPISPRQPTWFIHIDSWNQADPQKIIDMVPADIRPYVVFNISVSINHDRLTSKWLQAEYGYEIAKSWLRVCAENRVWAMIQQSSGGFQHFSETDLAVYEEFYRDYPNFIGFNYAEQFWGYDGSLQPPTSNSYDAISPPWASRISLFANLLELSNRYGGYLVVSWCANQWDANINPIGMLKRNPAFAAACRNYTQNYILCEKHTQQSYQYDMESTCLGAYVSGYAGQYGIRYDETGWTDATGVNANFTLATGLAPHLEHIMLTGQTVIDGPETIPVNASREISSTTTPDGFTTRRWEFYPQFHNISIDLFRKVLDGTVRIPTRREVIDRTKVVVINDVNSGSNQDQYSTPQTLFEGLYRMDGDGNYELNKTFFKKTGRYPTVPLVYQLDDTDANSFEVKVNKSAYATRWPSISSKTTEFNNLFASEYTGTLYAGRHENGWVTYNPFKINQTASATIPFKYNTCSSMELTYSQYSAGIVKEYSNRLNIYLNNYDNKLNTGLKTDVIRINGASAQPTWSYTERGSHQASVLSASWSGGVFTLTVQHNGALDIIINCSGMATGRLTNYTPAVLNVPTPPAIYQGPLQREAEHFDFKSINGNVANGVSGDVRNYTAQGYLRFGTNAGASIRDTLYVQHSGTYQLGTRYSVTGGNVNTIALYVNGVNVATPLFAQTSSYEAWAVNTQSITLNAGYNVIEFRATAAASNSVYFDNIVVLPVSSGGNIIQESTTGFCGVNGTVDSNNAGYTGTGFANTNNAAGTGIDWKINFASTGTKAFTFRYASTDTRTANLLVNGSIAAANISLPATGSWTTWNNITVYANTVSGISDVRLVATGASGLPNVDYLQVVGGTAANCATALTDYAIQENETGFCSVDGTIDNNYLGFVGSGFANTNNAVGAGVNWRVNFASAGTKSFTVRYASTESRPGRLIINGSIAIASVSLPATGSWSTWSTVTVTANTPAGIADVRLEATGSSGLGNIDYLLVANGSPSACQSGLLSSPITSTATGVDTDRQLALKENTIEVFPNPARQHVTVRLSSHWKAGDQIILCDVTGKAVISRRIKGSLEEFNISSLPAGLYLIRVFNSIAEQASQTLIKQ